MLSALGLIFLVLILAAGVVAVGVLAALARPATRWPMLTDFANLLGSLSQRIHRAVPNGVLDKNAEPKGPLE